MQDLLTTLQGYSDKYKYCKSESQQCWFSSNLHDSTSSVIALCTLHFWSPGGFLMHWQRIHLLIMYVNYKQIACAAQSTVLLQIFFNNESNEPPWCENNGVLIMIKEVMKDFCDARSSLADHRFD